MRKISWYYENFLMKWWEISWFCYVFMAPSSVFLTFSWEISHNIIILRFCNIVEGQAKYGDFSSVRQQVQSTRLKIFTGNFHLEKWPFSAMYMLSINSGRGFYYSNYSKKANRDFATFQIPIGNVLKNWYWKRFGNKKSYFLGFSYYENKICKV